MSAGLHITQYKQSRYFALWEGEQLIAVTVYKKGAQEIARRLGQAWQMRYAESPEEIGAAHVAEANAA